MRRQKKRLYKDLVEKKEKNEKLTKEEKEWLDQFEQQEERNRERQKKSQEKKSQEKKTCQSPECDNYVSKPTENDILWPISQNTSHHGLAFKQLVDGLVIEYANAPQGSQKRKDIVDELVAWLTEHDSRILRDEDNNDKWYQMDPSDVRRMLPTYFGNTIRRKGAKLAEILAK